MITNQYLGKLIVIEGLDGAGTTTQASLLHQWLTTSKGMNSIVTAEPSRGPIGALIRPVLTRRISMDHLTLAGMFAADRLDHLFNTRDGIVTYLRQGWWVILDRYYLSSFAYQASQLTDTQYEWLKTIHQPCISPDLTIFLDVPVDECLLRITKNRDKQYELFERKAMLKAVDRQYRKAIDTFTNEGETIVFIDGTQDINSVQSEIQKIIKAQLGYNELLKNQ